MSSKETPTTDLIKAEPPQPPEYTKGQIETLQILQRAEMAKFAFYFAISAFSFILLLILVSTFFGNLHYSVQIGLTLLDGLVGWLIRYIYKYLFPPVCKDAQTGEVKLAEPPN